METNARIRFYRRFAKLSCASYMLYGHKGKKETPESVKREREWQKVLYQHIGSPTKSDYESRRRARAAVFDIVHCNDFAYMVTLTFAPEVVDRKSSEDVYIKLSNWLRERVREGCIYVAVPELHKDGAIHVHCLFSQHLRVERSRYKSGHLRRDRMGRQVYNAVDWHFGLSWVTEITDDKSAAAYCTEYITKSGEKIFGKWYLSARECQKKPKQYDLPPVNEDQIIDTYNELGAEQYEDNPRPNLWIWNAIFWACDGDAVVLPCANGEFISLYGYSCDASARMENSR